MFKNKAPSGLLNLCGKRIRMYRLQMPKKTSQRQLAVMLQIHGLDLEKNAVQKIEKGERFVTDIELKAFAEVLGVSCDDLIN